MVQALISILMSIMKKMDIGILYSIIALIHLIVVDGVKQY